MQRVEEVAEDLDDLPVDGGDGRAGDLDDVDGLRALRRRLGRLELVGDVREGDVGLGGVALDGDRLRLDVRLEDLPDAGERHALRDGGDHPAEDLADVRRELLRDVKLHARDAVEDVLLRRPVERHVADEHDVEEDAEAPDVRLAPVVRGLEEDLRRDVVRRAAALLEQHPAGVCRHSKVTQLGAREVRSEEDVLELDVAVADAPLVHVLERVLELHEVVDRLALCQAALALDERVELAAREDLLDDKKVALRLVRRVELDDVRVVEDFEDAELLLDLPVSLRARGPSASAAGPV